MEFTPFLTLLVLTSLCMLLATTRKYAIVLAGLLMYFYPINSFVVLALAGIAYYFYRRKLA
ncbi:hypothetical protein ACFL3A_04525 [Pseudomonadota bacterium]